MAKIIKFPPKGPEQKKPGSERTYGEVRLARIIRFPQKGPEQKKFEEVLNRSFGPGEIPQEVMNELWYYTKGISHKVQSLRLSFSLPLPDTLTETDTNVISVSAQNSVDLFIDKGRKIFREMLREIILLKLALYRSKRSSQ